MLWNLGVNYSLNGHFRGFPELRWTLGRQARDALYFDIREQRRMHFIWLDT